MSESTEVMDLHVEHAARSAQKGRRQGGKSAATKSATQRHQVRFPAQAARRSEHGDISTRNVQEE